MDELNFETYTNNKVEKKLFYKIGLIGPSRVGKTSIIAALLEEAQAALAQSHVSIVPFVDEDGISPTQERIKNTISDIESGLDFCTFNPTGTGTADPFIFDLVMKIASQDFWRSGQMRLASAQLHLAILDYPGGWLRERPPGINQQAWENCKKWIKESSVIIVPIDANLIMEAGKPDQTKAVRELLLVVEVENLVREWAKGRWSEGESGLLLFVPVKCETYFRDNGGNNDKSQELYERVRRLYGGVIKAAQQEMSGQEGTEEQRIFNIGIFKRKPATYAIEYHPIDTIGCIELKNANWENLNGQLSLNCEYLVRNPGNSRPERKTLGTIGLLNSICKQIVENRQKRGGMFNKLWDWLNNNDTLLGAAINNLSQTKTGSRFKQIAKGNIANRG